MGVGGRQGLRCAAPDGTVLLSLHNLQQAALRRTTAATAAAPLTCPSTNIMSPTRVGLRNEIESMAAVSRWPPRQTRDAAMNAHCSIQRITCPPKAMPMELACCGRIICVMWAAVSAGRTAGKLKAFEGSRAGRVVAGRAERSAAG